VTYIDLFSNLCLHNTVIPHFISKSIYNYCYYCICILLFSSIDELTHSRELAEAVTQDFATNSQLLKRAEWVELCKYEFPGPCCSHQVVLMSF